MPDEAEVEGMVETDRRRIGISQGENCHSDNKTISIDRESRAVRTLADGGPRSGSSFTALMSDLMGDVLSGAVDHQKANAACNIAMVMLKAMELEYKIKKLERGGNGIGDSDGKARCMIFDLLSDRGEMKPAVIATTLEMPRSTVNVLIDHPWFERTPRGIRLAAEV